MRYVLKYLLAAIRKGEATDVEREWAEDLNWYGLTVKESNLLNRFRELFC